MTKRHFYAQWILLGLLAAAVLVGFLWLLSVSDSIQAERRDSVITSCQDQNRRHDKTLDQLYKAKDKADEKFNRAHPGPAFKALRVAHAQSTAAGVATFALIFNASTPHRNCTALADKFVQQGG